VEIENLPCYGYDYESRIKFTMIRDSNEEINAKTSLVIVKDKSIRGKVRRDDSSQSFTRF